MPTVRIQEKNYSESIMVLKPKDGHSLSSPFSFFMGWPFDRSGRPLKKKIEYLRRI